MSKAKVKLPETVSPLGIFKYAWLNKPDTKFAKDGDGGDFKVRHLMDDTPANRAWADKVIEDGKTHARVAGVKLKKGHKNPFMFPEDFDEDDFIPDPETGKVAYDEDHKGKIVFETKSKYKPGLIDAKTHELPEDVVVMSGDRGRIKVQINPYDGLGSGISLRLKVVQLIEKNTTYSGGGAVDTSGFGAVEGGYTAPEREEDDDDDAF